MDRFIFAPISRYCGFVIGDVDDLGSRIAPPRQEVNER